MNLSDILSKLGLAPKNLNEARETIAPAKATLEGVQALFASAGLNLDQLLAAGSDSLKAHLDGLSAKDGELAAAQASVTDLTAKLGDAEKARDEFKASAESHAALFAAVGFKPESNKAEELKPAFDKHVSLRAAELLAKTGTPPMAATVAVEAEAKKETTDAEHLAAYEKLPRGSAEAIAYAEKHYQAILRADRARGK